MTRLKILFHRLKGLVLNQRRERELQDEINSHLEMQIEDNLRQGMTAKDARRAALRKFGGVDQVKERYRAKRGLPLVETTLQDLRYATRMLTKSPVFTAVAILTIALGIGANTAIFTLFNLFYRSVPVKNPNTMVLLDLDRPAGFQEYIYLRDHTQSFSQIAASSLRGMVLAGSGDQETSRQITSEFVSDNFFSLLEARLLLGRTFTADENRVPRRDFVTVLSYEIWRSHFAENPNIIGQTVRINGLQFVVIGVTAPDFARFGFEGRAGLWKTDLWLPLMMKGTLHQDTEGKSTGMEWYESREHRWLSLFGSLKPDRTRDEARAEMTVLCGDFNRDLKNVYKGKVTIVPLTQGGITPETRTTMAGLVGIVMAATMMVLLIACMNIATLLIARSATRQKEIGIRLCIGANRRRLVRQLLTESVLLALAGGIAGLFVAWWSLRTFLITGLLSSLGYSELDKVVLLNVRPDTRVLGYTFLLSLVAAIAFGLVPAIRATRPDLTRAIKEDTAGFGNRTTRSKLSNALVAIQVALCLVLLIGTGLLLRGLMTVNAANPTFDPQKMLTLKFDTRASRYDEARVQQFHRELADRLTALPGIQSVSRAANVPGAESNYALLENQTSSGGDSPDPSSMPYSNAVVPGFFETAGIQIIRGRTFTEAERLAGNSILVSESMARKLSNDQDPLGKSLRFKRGEVREPVQIIGVVRDVEGIFGETRPLVYFPLLPNREREGNGLVFVRTSGDAKTMQPSVLKVAQALDPALYVKVTTVADYVGNTMRVRTTRSASVLAASLGTLALLLAGIGLYGVMAYSVTQQTHEIGIRMALGASRREVLRLVIGQGMVVVCVGIVLGIAGGAAASRVLSSLLFGLSPFDPITYISVSLFLLAVTIIASYLPARRAASVDPMVALRYE